MPTAAEKALQKRFEDCAAKAEKEGITFEQFLAGICIKQQELIDDLELRVSRLEGAPNVR